MILPTVRFQISQIVRTFPLSSGSSHCHYTPAEYSETAAIRISKEEGYKGFYAIEAVKGDGPDPYSAVQTSLDGSA